MSMNEFLPFINIALVVVMAILGGLFKMMHGQAMSTLKAIEDKMKKVDQHGESLAAGREKFASVDQRLHAHDEKFDEHGKRLYHLETRGREA